MGKFRGLFKSSIIRWRYFVRHLTKPSILKQLRNSDGFSLIQVMSLLVIMMMLSLGVSYYQKTVTDSRRSQAVNTDIARLENEIATALQNNDLCTSLLNPNPAPPYTADAVSIAGLRNPVPSPVVLGTGSILTPNAFLTFLNNKFTIGTGPTPTPNTNTALQFSPYFAIKSYRLYVDPTNTPRPLPVPPTPTPPDIVAYVDAKIDVTIYKADNLPGAREVTRTFNIRIGQDANNLARNCSGGATDMTTQCAQMGGQWLADSAGTFDCRWCSLAGLMWDPVTNACVPPWSVVIPPSVDPGTPTPYPLPNCNPGVLVYYNDSFNPPPFASPEPSAYITGGTVCQSYPAPYNAAVFDACYACSYPAVTPVPPSISPPPIPPVSGCWTSGAPPVDVDSGCPNGLSGAALSSAISLLTSQPCSTGSTTSICSAAGPAPNDLMNFECVASGCTTPTPPPCLADRQTTTTTIACPGPVFGSNRTYPTAECCSGSATYTCLQSGPVAITNITGTCATTGVWSCDSAAEVGNSCRKIVTGRPCSPLGSMIFGGCGRYAGSSGGVVHDPINCICVTRATCASDPTVCQLPP